MSAREPYWRLPGGEPFAAAKALAATGAAGVFLTVSTSIPSLSALGLDSDGEDALLRRAWDLTADRLPSGTYGKRAHWRGFLYVLPGARGDASDAARAILSALRADPLASRVAWQVVATPIRADWHAAHELAQPNRHAELGDGDLAVWVDPDADGIRITRL